MFEHFTVPSSLDDILYTLGHSLSYALIWPNLLYATAVISGKKRMRFENTPRRIPYS